MQSTSAVNTVRSVCRSPSNLGILRQPGPFWRTLLLCIAITYGYHLVILLAAVLGIPSRSITIPYRIVFLAFVLIMLARHQKTIIRCLSTSCLMQCLAVFWILYSLRLLNDLYLFPTSVRYPPWEYVALALGGTLLPSLTFAHQANWRAYRKVFRPFVATGIVAALISVWLFRDFVGTEFGRISYRNTGIAFGGLNAGYMASSLMVLGAYLIIERSRRSHVMIGALLCLVAVLPLALGSSRGPVVAVAICVGVHLYAQFRRGNARWSMMLIAAAIIGLPVLGRSFHLLGSNLVARFEHIDVDDLSTANARIIIWGNAWSQFLESPLTGSGLEERFRQHYPHNVVIESFMATGLIGGTAFVVFLIGAWLRAVRILRQPVAARSVGWVALLFVHYTINGMFSQSIYSNVGLWAFGVAVITVTNQHRIPLMNSKYLIGSTPALCGN